MISESILSSCNSQFSCRQFKLPLGKVSGREQIIGACLLPPWTHQELIRKCRNERHPRMSWHVGMKSRSCIISRSKACVFNWLHFCENTCSSWVRVFCVAESYKKKCRTRPKHGRFASEEGVMLSFLCWPSLWTRSLLCSVLFMESRPQVVVSFAWSLTADAFCI